MKRKVFLSSTALLREVGHRHRWVPRESKFRCSWCGAFTSKIAIEDRARWGRIVRICIDRQTMLFSEAKKNVARDSLGWTPVVTWNDRFKS